MVSVVVDGVTEALVEGTIGVGGSGGTIGGGAVNGDATGHVGVAKGSSTTDVRSGDWKGGIEEPMSGAEPEGKAEGEPNDGATELDLADVVASLPKVQKYHFLWS